MELVYHPKRMERYVAFGYGSEWRDGCCAVSGGLDVRSACTGIAVNCTDAGAACRAYRWMYSLMHALFVLLAVAKQYRGRRQQD